jgi:hypothetical protein
VVKPANAITRTASQSSLRTAHRQVQVRGVQEALAEQSDSTQLSQLN